ncbi:PTS sugar transporter subunit IIC [Kribbella sp. CA-245084]|uniref:PTS sugar transporter subunit IIC n=1 Tax=Kribbella sp. CA-245084 TaxID=3239940 RepID=UPI003D906CFA
MSEAEVSEDFIQRMTRRAAPAADAIANNKHINAIQAGMCATIAVMLVGSIFMIIKTPPVNQTLLDSGGFWSLFEGWYGFSRKQADTLTTAYNMTIGLLALVAAFSIAYELAKRFKLPELSSGIISVITFLLVCAPMTTYKLADGTDLSALSSESLGASGLFTAILIGLLSVDIAKFCMDRKIYIRLPDVVSAPVRDAFSSLIPMLLNVLIFGGISLFTQTQFGLLLPEAVMKLLAAPLSSINTIQGVFLMLFLRSFFWIFGINGSQVLYPITYPLTLMVVTANATLVTKGMPPVFSPIMLINADAMIGGTGNTLGFSILCLRSKSKRLVAIGRASIVPSLFQHNEVAILGAPVSYNPILAVPFVGGTLIVGLLMWLGYASGFLIPRYVMSVGNIPIGFKTFLEAMSWQTFIFPFLLIPVLMAVWYPFFKVYEKKLVHAETSMELATQKV